MPTRGEQMQALRRARMAAAPPLLRGGFRPFFLGGALWSVAALLIWLGSLAGILDLPSAVDGLSWHRHEMLFGFVGAVVAGFLLTAIPNWTGRLPIAGLPLALLVTLWFGGRVAFLFSGVTGHAFAAVVDVGFLLAMAALCAQEVIAAGNRNLPIVGAVLLLACANALDHAAMAGVIDDSMIGMRFGIAVVTLLIALIGGRIVPSFTRNWLMKRGERERLPTQPGRFDRLAIGATAFALLAWVVLAADPLTGGLLALAGLLQLARLARWHGHRAVRDPLVLILHVGYAWVPAGLLLLAASILSPAIPMSAAVHALTAGAMATMILAVMTRASLGHTGRELRSDGATSGIFALITLAALARVAAPFDAERYTELMRAGGLLWVAAFLLFLLRYSPILLRPRLGESA